MTSPFPSRAQRHEQTQTQHRHPVRSGRKKARNPWQHLGFFAAMVLLFAGVVGAGDLASRQVTLGPRTVDLPLDPVRVSGRQGATPVLELLAPLDFNSAKVQTEVYGQGRVIEDGTPVLLSITAFDGESGETLNEDGHPTLLVASATEEDLGATLKDLVVGQAEGSRVVVARPLSEGGVEVDVVDIMPSIAAGEFVNQKGPLKVTFTANGPRISRGKNPPSDLEVQVLVQGDGPQVHTDDEVVLQYYAVNWGEREVLSSTWAEGMPTQVRLAEAMPGVAEAVIDQRVGSRLAVTVPPEMASGEDTVALVLDILAAVSVDTDQGEN